MHNKQKQCNYFERRKGEKKGKLITFLDTTMDWTCVVKTSAIPNNPNTDCKILADSKPQHLVYTHTPRKYPEETHRISAKQQT